MKIAFVTSQGGHSGQIKIIFTPEVIGKNEAILVTERPGKNNKPKEKYFHKKYKTYFFEKDVLLTPNPWRYLKTMMRLIRLFRTEKIDMVVTNGAQLSIPAVIGAKLIGIKTVFLDTVIRVNMPNWSARACYPFADIFLVQHEGMKNKYGRKAKYIGGVL